MKDRVPLYPGRVTLTPVSGQANTYDLTRADQPTQEGTPLNKANLLKDSTAAAFGKTNAAVPDDILNLLSKSALSYTEAKSTKTTIGTLAVGKTITMNVGGAAKEFTVVHQGKPSSLYDDSCNGTWLLMKDCYEKRQWNFSNVNKLESSDIHTYLNNTFLNMFDSNIKDSIKQVKIPYRKNGGSGGTDESGSNGLPVKIFLLSGYEVGGTTSDVGLPVDGAKLSYFESGTSTSADSKRIANLNDSATDWWLRSPDTTNTGSVWCVRASGSFNTVSASVSYGIRPALILPSTFAIYTDSSGNIYTEQEYETKITDVLGNLISIPADQIKDGVKIATGSYTGTGTYGESHPNSLTFAFEPKLVFLTRRYTTSASISTTFPIPAAGDGIIFTRNAATFFGSGSQNGIGYSLVAKCNGRTITWYSTYNAAGQGNVSSITYDYTAIG